MYSAKRAAEHGANHNTDAEKRILKPFLAAQTGFFIQLWKDARRMQPGLSYNRNIHNFMRLCMIQNVNRAR